MKYKLIIFLTALLCTTAVVHAWADSGVKEDANGNEVAAAISASAVHSDLSVGVVLPAEEVKEESDGSVVSADSDDMPDDSAVPDDGGLTEEVTELDLWDMGLQWYGISYEDTNRALRLITYEGYGYSPLSFYVACACWVRATEGYWGYGNLYSAFGEADTSYDLWMDGLGIADYAYVALEQCYRDPMYVRYCNGMTVPWDWIYYEDGIYVWN